MIGYPKSSFIVARAIVYVIIALLSGVVLGIGIDFSNKFSPLYHQEITIPSIVFVAITWFCFIIILSRSSPKYDLIVLSFLAILWLVLGIISSVTLNHTSCGSGGTIPTKTSGQISLSSYCTETRAIQVVSWINFVLLISSFILLLALCYHSISLGNRHIWNEDIRNIVWFGNGEPEGSIPYRAEAETRHHRHHTAVSVPTQPVYYVQQNRDRSSRGHHRDRDHHHSSHHDHHHRRSRSPVRVTTLQPQQMATPTMPQIQQPQYVYQVPQQVPQAQQYTTTGMGGGAYQPVTYRVA